MTFKEIVGKVCAPSGFGLDFSLFFLNHRSTVSFLAALFYLCLCGVGAIVQLQEELAGPSAQQRCVSSKMREEFVRTGHLDPEKHVGNGRNDDLTGYA